MQCTGARMHAAWNGRPLTLASVGGGQSPSCPACRPGARTPAGCLHATQVSNGDVKTRAAGGEQVAGARQPQNGGQCSHSYECGPWAWGIASAGAPAAALQCKDVRRGQRTRRVIPQQEAFEAHVGSNPRVGILLVVFSLCFAFCGALTHTHHALYTVAPMYEMRWR